METKQLNYVIGDATNPRIDRIYGKAIITHVCNDVGAWGAGFVMAISKKWKEPEIEYKKMSNKTRKLGYVQFVPVENNIIIANLIGQHDIKSNENGVPPINYAAIEIGLNKIFKFANNIGASVHMPRIGCGLAGGSWEIMELIIKRAQRNHNVKIYVYDLK
jgi:O-acetyl-ADP-ribose deacetylase (regulator of RNase III)